MTHADSWIISLEDKAKYDAQFSFLRPIDGFISGDQAKNIFLKSGLNQQVLHKIWDLSDLTSDGKLDKKEFSIALFLIQKSLEGHQLPDQLPNKLLEEPQSSSTVIDPFMTNDNFVQQNDVWSIPQSKMPKYKLKFNEYDKNRKGYLTGNEARSILLKSGLSQSILAHIWNLSDINNDGCLSPNEFCIASYLIEQALSGRILPQTLPKSLDLGNNNQNPLENLSFSKNDFEVKRQENFQLGQAELDRRKRELREQMEREEEIRRKQQQAEEDRLEAIRKEQERQRFAEEAKKAEQKRLLLEAAEKQRQEAHNARVEAYRKLMLEKSREAEKVKCENLKIQHAQLLNSIQEAQNRRTLLLKTATEQLHNQKELETSLLRAQTEYNDFRDLFGQMRLKRNQYEEDIRGLSEKLAQLASERSQIQREMILLKESNPLGFSNNSHLIEKKKNLTNDLDQKRANINRLQENLKTLTTEITSYGTELANRRNRAKELDEKAKDILTESTSLRNDLLKNDLTGSKAPLMTSSDNQIKSSLPFNWKENDTRDLFAIELTNAKPIISPVQNNTLANFEDPFGSAFDNDPFAASICTTKVDTNQLSLPFKESDMTTFSNDTIYRASFDFNAIRSDEISFIAGDRIRLISREPGDGWLTGELIDTPDKRRGFFPESYTCPIGDNASTVRAPKQMIDPFDPFSVHKDKKVDPFAVNPIDPFSPLASNEIKPLSITNGSVKSDAFALFQDPFVNVNPAIAEIMFECCSIYPYESDVAGDLSFQAGETICVTGGQNQDWYNGFIKGDTMRKGMFPVNYVKKIEALNSTLTEQATDKKVSENFNEKDMKEEEITIIPSSRPEIATVIAAYEAKEANQLTLTPGQFVQIKRRSAKGWWEGEVQQRGQKRRIGWFPADYVRINTTSVNKVDDITNKSLSLLSKDKESPKLNGKSTKTAPARPPPPQETSSSTHSSPEKVVVDTTKASITKSREKNLFKALYSYTATHNDELTFVEGDIIIGLSQDEPGWWRGLLEDKGIEGLFPANYVEPITSPKSHRGSHGKKSHVGSSSTLSNTTDTDQNGNS